MTVLLLNVGAEDAAVTLRVGGAAAPSTRTEYRLTGPGGANATSVALNGRVLRLGAGDALPSLHGAEAGGRFALPAASIVFAELHGAGAAAGCAA